MQRTWLRVSKSIFPKVVTSTLGPRPATTPCLKFSRLLSGLASESVAARTSDIFSTSILSPSQTRATSLEVPICGQKQQFDYLWLRDHCQCSECIHPISKQRMQDTLDIPEDVAPRRVQMRADSLAIDWSDNHVSEYSMAFLSGLAPSVKPPAFEPTVWDASSLPSVLPRADFRSVSTDNDALKDFLSELRRFGFAFIDGVSPDADTTMGLANRLGVTRKTIFGDFWDFTADWTHSDTAYSDIALPLHTDSTYFTTAPGFQMFHLLEFAGTGGESLLADGFAIAKWLREHRPESFHILSTVPLPYRYLDIERGIHFENSTVTFTLDEDEVKTVRFNDSDRAPISLATLAAHNVDVRTVNTAIRDMCKALRDPQFLFQFQLQPGSALVFDNQRTFHGRTAFTGRRRLCGAYWEQEDLASSLRAHGGLRASEAWR
mmetsp:Transcript_10274/g.23417  ORF Transcript_10274/g.23417 Transcript_10274/m.23417 type:complete len:433 (+) Transcript_10274:118-1416(+)|eukprot:CAMPEP_0114553324 /NCGR_PEP_ID=MMETSP0114-20121206/7594_1 /TAXON_ID=31324 /ORGANISM="Goniomonas sp, Strain m" /LENGTH=432 /DNA_ID=CAMNT_0001738253 /DNA_START=111 /DNA_END=1409 /DNA_ORIENTATION=-